MNRVALGLDAGGTSTRWVAISDADEVRAQGEVIGLTALLLHSSEGVEKLKAAFEQIADALSAHRSAGDTLTVCAGFTGIDGHSQPLAQLIANAFAIDANDVQILSDIELAYRGAFKAGEGYVVYAGTGSIAAFVDERNVFHRAGGRGVGLDDGGGGYWMAREALRAVWRREDELPGAWVGSALAHALFARIGGSNWDHSRTFFYSRERGEIGKLALAVQETADSDPLSRDILRRAGIELARLAQALINQFGARPIALAGRAFRLHPIIEASFRERLPGAKISFVDTFAAMTAARLALNSTSRRKRADQ